MVKGNRSRIDRGRGRGRTELRKTKKTRKGTAKRQTAKKDEQRRRNKEEGK